MKGLIEYFREPLLGDLNVDGNERLLLHSKVLSRKKLLKTVFTEFHHLFLKLDNKYFEGEGSRVELGAGVAPIRDTYPDVLATDIVQSQYLDRVIDAECMDVESGSLRALYGQNCFHHFPHPERFFAEVDRVLSPGGGLILLEPYYGPFASFLFKRLFKSEGFDKSFSSWETPALGPMNGANQALSYIVFVRDRGEFEKKYPNLKVVEQELCGNYVKYLLSGGLNFRQMVPDWISPLVSAIQYILSPLDRVLSLHHVIVIKKV